MHTVDAAAIRAAVDVFYERMLAEPTVQGMWDGVDMRRLRGHQRALILQVLGGPALYQGRDLKTAHSGLGISAAQFEVAMGHLLDALIEVGVAPDVIERAAGDLDRMRGLIVAD